MIVGNGVVASAFKRAALKLDNLIIFASGVSNSSETRASEFERERDLLTETVSGMASQEHIIYFSTINIYDKNLCQTEYVKHKLAMETILKERCKSYLVVRLSHLIGVNGNKLNLINFLYEKIKGNSDLIIWKDAGRYLIYIDEMVDIVSYLIQKQSWNKTVNVGYYKIIMVVDLVRKIETALNKVALVRLEDAGDSYEVDFSEMVELDNEFGIFGVGYYEKSIARYITSIEKKGKKYATL